MAQFVMPALGADMTEGTLAAWRRQPGDRVERGDIIAEVETEKGIIEVEVFTTGVIESLLVEPGAKVPVGTPLAVIDERASGVSAAEPPVETAEAAAPAPPAAPTRPVAALTSTAEPGAAAQSTRPQQGTPSARRLAYEGGVDLTRVEGTGGHGTVTRADVARALAARPTPAAQPKAATTRTRISPLARRRARALGVDLARVAPSAVDHVVHLRDVEREAARVRRPAAGDKRAAMRRAIAAAMSRAKREIPHYYLSTTVDMAPLMHWLAAQNQRRAIPERLIPGVCFLKAVALAMREVPEMNAHWTGDDAPPLPRVHVGVAISLRRGGLVAPAIHDTDQLSLSDLMRAFKDLVTRARAGTLRSSEMTDATVTVTSLGERGVETVFPIINPPQVAMVGFGRISERPWTVDGSVVPRPLVTATLAADHRVSDGHRGGLYLAAIERLLQTPERL